VADEKEKTTDVRGQVIDGEVFINANDMIVFISRVNAETPSGVAKKITQYWIDWLIKYKENSLRIKNE